MIFDVFRTLLLPVAGHEQTFAEGLRSAGIEPDDDLFGQLQASSEGLDHRWVSTSRDVYVSWAERVLDGLAGDGIQPGTQPFVIPALEQLHQAPMRPMPGVVSLLEELRSRAVITAVCSNWSWDLPEDLAAAGIGSLIDVVETSARAGFRKPHAAIYEGILRETGVAAADALYVGDSPTADVKGPMAVGIPAVHLVPPSQPSPANRRIADIADLRRFLPP